MKSPAIPREPVFIVGMPRSGTTLLYRTLLRHPSFRPARPAAVSYLVETKAFQHSEGLGPHVFHFMQDDEELYEACRRESGGVLAVRRLMNRLGLPHALTGAPPAVRSLWWRLTGSRRLVLTAFRYAAAARQAERLLEKTPNHALYLPEIAATFPDASVLWIHRHPVDVYASYRRRGETEIAKGMTAREDNRWLKVTPSVFCSRHREFTDALRAARRGGSLPLYVQPYEAFTAEPAASFAALCRFLGIPFTDDPVSGGSTDIEDPRDPLLSAPIRRETKDWTKYLTEEECRLVERELAADLDDLGYEPRSAP